MHNVGSSVVWVLLFLDNRVGSPSPEHASSGCYCLSVVMFERLRNGIGRVFFQGDDSWPYLLSTNNCKDSKMQRQHSNFHFCHNQKWTSTSRFAFTLIDTSGIRKKNPKHREILVLLHHLKNSSLFCVCVEAAGFTKLSYYLPCVTSALHCREQKEQLCYTEFNHLFFSDCRSTEHSVHSRLCLQPSLAAARKKTNLFVKQISYSSGLSSKAATKSMLLAD